MNSRGVKEMKQEKEKENDSYVLEDDGTPVKIHTMWSIVPRIMIMPGAGWKLLWNNGPLPEVAGLRFLIPISLISGASEFFVYLYQVQVDFADVLVSSVIQFCSFFLGYFLSLLFLKLALPKDSKSFADTHYCKLMVMTAIGTLAFFHFLFMALPMFDFVLEFLPLWTVFLLYEGLRQKHISDSMQLYATAAVCVIVICAPFLIEWILTLFM